jgi:selenocysteine-specific elongation factor
LRAGDRFIIRSLSPAFTIGGGKVLLTDVGQRTMLSQPWFELLELLDAGKAAEAVLQFAELQSLPMTAHKVATRLGINTTDAARSLNQSDLARLKVGKETLYLPESALQQTQASLEAALLDYHEKHPKALDISQGALRGLVFPSASTPQAKAWTEECFEALLLEMSASGTLAFEAGKVSHMKAASSVQALHKQLSRQLDCDICAQGLAVESIAEHAARLKQPREFVAQILGQLTRDEKLIRLAVEYHFSPKHITAAQEALVRELKSRNEGMTAAEIRDLWQVSRKYAIPLLEYCDAQGITRREGDLRFLK